MDNIKVSVIVPVYNNSQYIGNTIDSIINQDFDNYEIIVIDDGSTDDTGSIIDAYAEKDPRIVAIHQENAGVCVTRNNALDWVYANSTSEWIFFIDNDDWMHPRTLELLYRAATDALHRGWQ